MAREVCGGMHASRVAGAVVALVLALGLAVQPLALSAGQGVSAGAAREYVKRVEWLYEYTLNLTAEYNVTLPQGLREKLDEAGALLQQARQALDAGDVDRAVALATRAARLLSHVAGYVWSHLAPEERMSEREQLLTAQLDARERALERVEALVEKLKSQGAPVPGVVEERLSKAREELEAARQALDSGNLQAAKAHLRRFDVLLHQALRALYAGEERFLHSAAAAAAAARGVARALNVTAARVAVVVEGLSNGSMTVEQAIAVLNGVDHKLAGVERALDRILAAAERFGVDENTTKAIEEALNYTRDARANVSDAIAALQENDTATAVLDLQAALDDLQAALQALNSTNLPAKACHMLEEAVKAREKAAWAFKKHQEKLYAKISMQVDKIMHQLERVKRLHDRGMISDDQARHIFQKALEKLERLKAALDDNAPDWLVKKIDRAIQWIQENMP